MRAPAEQIPSITAYHDFLHLPHPKHPLVSIVHLDGSRTLPDGKPIQIATGFYSVALKTGYNGALRYGQQEYDFTSGVMAFLSPGQTLSVQTEEQMRHTGQLLFIHPDFLLGTPLAERIRHYEYFGYEVNEALHLSEAEKETVTDLLFKVEREINSGLDDLGRSVVIAQIDLLLLYAQRFYQRQFQTRKPVYSNILTRLEDILAMYFDSGHNSIPSVQDLSTSLHLSPNYLSTILKTLTGKSTQEHIHDRLISTAKKRLSTTALSVNEVAYGLGFEYVQSFNKLFKSKTGLSPQAFRKALQ